jgi:acetolactate synthase-1/2/3 large subunit
MHFVAALDQVPGMHCVLGLQENVVTGMADGYYRIAGSPACTLLHCGPGLANGLANLHNARRARSGIVNIVGDHATYHRALDAPLTSDIDSLARAVSSWTKSCADAQQIGSDAAMAVQAACEYPGNVVTLILPSDVSWSNCSSVGPTLPRRTAVQCSPAAIEDAARALRRNGRSLMLLAGDALSADAQGLLLPLVEQLEVDVLAEYSVAKIARGAGRLRIERMPYASDKARALLSRYARVILVNAVDPVGFFAYPNQPSRLVPERTEIIVLSRPTHDALAALRGLHEALGVRSTGRTTLQCEGAVEPGRGKPTSEGLARTVAALMPEHSIVSDESISFGRSFYQHTFDAAPHDWLHLTGGAIGGGLPMATGAAIAAKRQRRVISLQADGSAMYSIQSLWTQARERLPCTTIILNNGQYKILLGEYSAVGAAPGKTAMSMLDLGSPSIDFVRLANALGVEAARATTLEECGNLMQASFSTDAPFLIDLAIRAVC